MFPTPILRPALIRITQAWSILPYAHFRIDPFGIAITGVPYETFNRMFTWSGSRRRRCSPGLSLGDYMFGEAGGMPELSNTGPMQVGQSLTLTRLNTSPWMEGRSMRLHHGCSP